MGRGVVRTRLRSALLRPLGHGRLTQHGNIPTRCIIRLRCAARYSSALPPSACDGFRAAQSKRFRQLQLTEPRASTCHACHAASSKLGSRQESSVTFVPLAHRQGVSRDTTTRRVAAAVGLSGSLTCQSCRSRVTTTPTTVVQYRTCMIVSAT